MFADVNSLLNYNKPTKDDILLLTDQLLFMFYTDILFDPHVCVQLQEIVLKKHNFTWWWSEQVQRLSVNVVTLVV